MFMARTDPQLNFRIPAELKKRLEKAAAENQRTLTAELVNRLEHSLSDAPNVNTIDLLDMVMRINEEIQALRAVTQKALSQEMDTQPKVSYQKK